jgi:putative ABC transport system substrate-binding protein
VAAHGARAAAGDAGDWILNGQSADTYAHLMAALRTGLNEAGYVEGCNLAIDYRWGEGRDDRLPALAADLVKRQVAVIVTGGTPASTITAKAATSTIPIVFTTGTDPVKLGLVASYNRPGGNITGVAFLVNQLAAKRLEMLHALLPKVSTVAALLNLKHPNAASDRKDVEDAARSIGLDLFILDANTDSEIDATFAALAERKGGALFVNRLRSSTVAAARLLGSLRGMPCLRFTKRATTSPPAA